MKTNAIIRIVIWSIVIVLLLGIMCSVIFGINLHFHGEPPEETIIAVPITSPTQPSRSALIRGTQTVYSAPNKDASIVGSLESGESVTVERVEAISNAEWAFLSSPIQGWVIMDGGIYFDESTPSTGHDAEPGEKYTIPADQVEEIEIEWAAGEILIQPGDVEDITFSEDNVSDTKYAMVWKQSGRKLSISFCADTSFGLGISINNNINKDLTILVPRTWVCEALEIDAASATVEINDMTIREVDFDGASGTCEFENCTVDEFDVDTASGDIRFIGTLNILDCDAASANIYAVLDNTPSRLDMDTMSGDLDITLPEDAGFAISMDGLSTSFSSDFETTVKNGNHVCGDGSCRININAMSGDVILRKGEATPLATAAHHEHTEQCQTDPNSCPDTHHHTDTCVTTPDSCPQHTTTPHQHTDTCTTDPSSCPDHASAETTAHHAEETAHH